MTETSPVAAVLAKHRPTYPDPDNHTWFCTGCPASGVGWGQWVEHATQQIAEAASDAVLIGAALAERVMDYVAQLSDDDDDEALLRKRVI